MKLVKWTDQIEYLVNRKFPGSNAPPPINPLSSRSSGGSYNYEAYQKRIADIKTYKDELFKKTQNEVKGLYDEEYEKEVNAIQLKIKLEEQSRFFNQSYANADYVHWSKAAHWTLDEAIALSFGKSPAIVSWKTVEPLTKVSFFANDYAKRRDLALRALPWKKLFDPMLPTIFISWANELDIELPTDLISNVEKKLGIAINWHNEYKKLKAAYDVLQNNSVTANTNLANVEKNSDYKTDLMNIQDLATNEFFNPRKNVDAKKEEVIEWIKAKMKEVVLLDSNNIAEAMFTIIKPSNHNPKKKRVQP